MADIYKIITFNVGSSSTLGGLTSILNIEKPHIVMLQEVTLTSEQLTLHVSKFGYSAETNIDINNQTALGTGFVWKSNLPVSDVYNVIECRGQTLKLGVYNFLNIYAPSGSNHKQSRRIFFGQDVFRLVRGLDKKPPIIAGDFNCVLSDKDTERNFIDKKCPALKDLVHDFSYSDPYRLLNPDGKDFTFCRPNCAASRLDRFYLPPHLAGKVESVSHHASLSDHKYAVMLIVLPDLSKQPDPPISKSPYWKLNTSILKDEDFLQNFSRFYEKLQVKIDNYENIACWWDFCAKPAIKKFCMGVSTHLANIRRDTKRYLFSYLNVVMKQGDWQEVTRIRQQIKTILLQESMGFVVRSRFKENSEAEVASLFHTNREKKNSSKNNLDSLTIEGQVTSNKDTIEEKVIKYFGALLNGHHDNNLVDTGQPFVPDNSCLPDFLSGLGKLSQESKTKLAQDLSFSDVEHIIKHECDNNKSPGLDGLPYELYKATWEIIGQDFVKVLQVELANFQLIDSDRQGATRLASKVDGVPTVTELRPITLLNCDYKILSKCFVRRLTPMMCEIILSGQLCSNGSKNILFGISNIMSSIDYVNMHKVSAYLASYDMYKAYDRVMLSYLVKVLEAMNFPERFVKWILMLHEGATTRFILNFLTNPIQVLFSIRQGDPLKMILYIIYIEPLLMMIKRMTRGLNVSFVSQRDDDFCDDVNFVGEKLSDLLIIDEIFCNFETVSGAILSRTEKSKVMGLGAWQGKQDWPLPWMKVVPMIKMFGFQVTPVYKQTIKQSWETCYSGFNSTIMSWSSRQLNTMIQRVEVLRLFATSKLWYKASALPLPSSFSKKFESLMGRFLWAGKLERLQIDELKNSRSSGGLGLPCVWSKANALFLRQTCRLLLDSSSKQYGHVRYWLGLHLGEYFPEMSSGPHAEFISPYFQHMRLLLTEGLVLGDISAGTLGRVTAKELYDSFTSSLPPPKVVFKYEVDWQLVWERLDYSVLDPLGREFIFMIVHNIVPTRERLYMKMHMVDSPNCVLCNVREDITHMFTECIMVREAWGWARQRMLSLLPDDCAATSNFEFLHLMFLKDVMDKEVVWLLGMVLEFIWEEKLTRKKIVKLEHLVGNIKMKYKSNQFSRKPSLGHILSI